MIVLGCWILRNFWYICGFQLVGWCWLSWENRVEDWLLWLISWGLGFGDLTSREWSGEGFWPKT